MWRCMPGRSLALLLYFFKDWLTLLLCGLGLKYPATATRRRDGAQSEDVLVLVIGTIPAGVAGLLFHHQIEETLRQPKIIGVSLVVIALLMWWADSKKDLTRKVEDSNLRDGLIIGTAQALALWPGVSRSGITITAGLFRRLTREAATRFSFILSVPAIAGAVVMELPKLLKTAQGGRTGPAALDPADQHSGFGRGGVFRDFVFFALLANTHIESICCVPAAVWYHRAGFVVPPGGSAIAPAPAATLSLPQKLRRILCVF